MATEAQKTELREKIERLVTEKYKGDWSKAYNHYAAKNGGAQIDRDDLLALLEDAGIGSWLTRGAWADGIMEEVDTNSDKQISWEEFQGVLKREGG